MKITSIKPQEKRKDRYSVFVENKYAFSLSEGALLEQQLVPGQELTEAELEKFKKLSLNDKAYSNTLRYAAMRLRSEWELQEYMRRKGIDEAVAHTILAKLRNIGLVNDETFARAWVENRRLLKPVSIRRLVLELQQKRIAEETIRHILHEDQTDERTVLRDLIAKKQRQTKYREDKTKLMQYLARQGFRYDDIQTALNE